MRRRREGMSVVVATAYMEEAEAVRLAHRHERGQGAWRPDRRTTSRKEPAPRRSRTPSSSLLPPEMKVGHRAAQNSTAPQLRRRAPVIVARDLTRRFGDFTAVDHVSFDIGRGEIFGFVGSNGCGKTTTMKMLTGLLPSTRGRHAARAPDRCQRHEFAHARRLHVAIIFALYRTHGPAEPRPARPPVPLATRGTEAAHRRSHLALRPCRLCRPAGLDDLPLGIRQRLSLAVAVVHEPETSSFSMSRHQA